MTDLSQLGKPPPDPADEARNQLLAIITAARISDMQLASVLTNEYAEQHGTLLPLFISSVSLIESILRTVSDAMEIPPDKLFSGICLGLSVKAIEEQQQQQRNQED